MVFCHTGRATMMFVIIVLVGTVILRKSGWALSRSFLYTAHSAIAAITCVLWGIFVAFLLHALIRWQDPNIFIKLIIGYGFGSYVSIPNYGLVNQSTIPVTAMPRHTILYLLPLAVFLLSSIIFAFI